MSLAASGQPAAPNDANPSSCSMKGHSHARPGRLENTRRIATSSSSMRSSAASFYPLGSRISSRQPPEEQFAAGLLQAAATGPFDEHEICIERFVNLRAWCMEYLRTRHELKEGFVKEEVINLIVSFLNEFYREQQEVLDVVVRDALERKRKRFGVDLEAKDFDATTSYTPNFFQHLRPQLRANMRNSASTVTAAEVAPSEGNMIHSRGTLKRPTGDEDGGNSVSDKPSRMTSGPWVLSRRNRSEKPSLETPADECDYSSETARSTTDKSADVVATAQSTDSRISIVASRQPAKSSGQAAQRPCSLSNHPPHPRTPANLPSHTGSGTIILKPEPYNPARTPVIEQPLNTQGDAMINNPNNLAYNQMSPQFLNYSRAYDNVLQSSWPYNSFTSYPRDAIPSPYVHVDSRPTTGHNITPFIPWPQTSAGRPLFQPDLGRPSWTDPLRYANPAHMLQGLPAVAQPSVQSLGRPNAIVSGQYQPKPVPSHSTGLFRPETARVTRPAFTASAASSPHPTMRSSGPDNLISQPRTNTALQSTALLVHTPSSTQSLRRPHVLQPLKSPPQPQLGTGERGVSVASMSSRVRASSCETENHPETDGRPTRGGISTPDATLLACKDAFDKHVRNVAVPEAGNNQALDLRMAISSGFKDQRPQSSPKKGDGSCARESANISTPSHVDEPSLKPKLALTQAVDILWDKGRAIENHLPVERVPRARPHSTEVRTAPSRTVEGPDTQIDGSGVQIVQLKIEETEPKILPLRPVMWRSQRLATSDIQEVKQEAVEPPVDPAAPRRSSRLAGTMCEYVGTGGGIGATRSSKKRKFE